MLPLIFTLFPFFQMENQCRQIMCIAPPPTAEQYMLQKNIIYSIGGNWPKYYDCGWILTEAYRHEWYKWPKIHSWFLVCQKSKTLARSWDILVNQNPWERHVALITSNYSQGSVYVLDYVAMNTRASYRKHALYEWTFVLDKECLLTRKIFPK